MRIKVRSRLRGDAGASLMLALAFLTAFSTISVAMLSLNVASFKATNITKAEVDTVYAADAGFEYGTKYLTATSSACSASSTTYNWSTGTTINGANTTYSCTGTGGTAAGVTGSPLLGSQYSAITSGAGGNAGIWVDGTSPATVTLNINGSWYSNADLHFDDASHESVYVNGNTTANSSVSSAVCGYTNVTEAGTCSAGTTPAYTAPTAYIPGTTASNTGSGLAPAPWVKTSGTPGCTVLYPGRYTTAPTFTAGNNYYLASGTYYFVGTGAVNLQGNTIFGGAKVSGDTKFLSSYSACATDSDATGHIPGYTATGSGVELVLGGNAELHVKNDSTHLELYPRVSSSGVDGAATDGVSIWAQASSTGNITGSSYTGSTIGTGNAVVFFDDDLTDSVIHGLTYIPDSKVQIHVTQNAEAGNKAVLYGGVVTVKIWIFTTTGDNWTMNVAGSGSYTGGTPRVVTLTATATGGGSTSTIVGTVTYPVGGGAPTITDWHKTG
jgi:hypothetical protein